MQVNAKNNPISFYNINDHFVVSGPLTSGTVDMFKFTLKTCIRIYRCQK